MELVYEMTYRAMLHPAHGVGAGPYGERVIYSFKDGFVEGDRVSGKLIGTGADWLLVGADGFGLMDVRTQFQTDDGAIVYMYYHGLIELNERVRAAMEQSLETQLGDHYWRTSIRFETGDSRYAWLNQSMFVGEGRLYPGLGVQYKIYRVA